MKRSTQLHAIDILKIILISICTLAIPALLCLYAVRTNQYSALTREISQIEREEAELIEENKRLVSEISKLSSAERIEKIATEELGMHKAEKEDIIRVEMTGDKKDE
ncbi:MAG: cell division protein FtsL [Treponema sp.]|nr:cell division protein FtsL [Treponema sp.]